jgi:hypothetical protein
MTELPGGLFPRIRYTQCRLFGRFGSPVALPEHRSNQEDSELGGAARSFSERIRGVEILSSRTGEHPGSG